MSALDFAARSMARRALETGSAAAELAPALASGDGAFSIGRKRSEGAAVLETIQTALDRIDLSPASFGALANGGGVDRDALQAFASAVGGAGNGLGDLEAKTYSTGGDGVNSGWVLGQSDVGFRGRGMSRTFIENIHANAGFAAWIGQSCENNYFADMTFRNRFAIGGNGPHSIRNVVFHRCGFTSNQVNGAAGNALTLYAGPMDTGLQFIFFIDCVFYGAGRMGVEVTNHAGPSTIVKYGNIHFINCRFVNNGHGVGSGIGFGASVSGKGERVVFDRCHWDGNAGSQLENAGCDRMLVRDCTIRASTLPTGVRPISFSAVNQASNGNHGCVIDGLTLVNNPGEAMGRPTMKEPFYFSSSCNLTLRNISAAVSGAEKQVILIAQNGTDSSGTPRLSENITITDCDLASDSAAQEIISFAGVHGHQIVARNTLHNSNAERWEWGGLVANWGGPGVVQLDSNRMSAAVPNGEVPFISASGTGTFTIAPNNIGLPTTFRQIVTIPTGQTTSETLAHGLPTVTGKQKVSVKPLGDLCGASFPYGSSHGGGTHVRANVEKAPNATVQMEVEVEYAY